MLMECVYRIRGIFRRCRAFVSRGRHGYARTDTGNVNMYVARIVTGILTEYMKELESPTTVAGHPSVLEGLESPQDEWIATVREMRRAEERRVGKGGATRWSTDQANILHPANRRERYY